jgi:hypothetical protein
VLIEGLAGGYYLDEKRKPVKDGYYDHLCLDPSTPILTPNGERSLCFLRAGDRVLTPSGIGTVTDIGQTAQMARRFKLSVAGREIIGTGNHPVLTQRGWIDLDALRYGDYVVTYAPEPTPESKGDSPSLSGVSGQEILPLWEVPVDADRVQPAGVPASSGLGGEERSSSSGEGDSPSEREAHGQQTLQFGGSDTCRAHPAAHDPGTDGSSHPECREVRSAGCESVARLESREGVAFHARSGDVEASEALQSAVCHLLRDSEDEGSEAAFLRTQMQGGSLQATASWVRQEVQAGEVWNLTVEPQHAFVAAGFVLHNCDAFRYGVHMLFGNGASPQLAGMMYRAMGAANSYTQAESVEYRSENDPYYHPYFDRK